ncbi:hypothetical protein [Nocardia australiensis]|uniref:hypothetical protein n=1 Tax=Nocardia australiensis TaxID=2887191 RepID=UPI001D14D924|nr:hypothetical protein [Nocardia australiensis]
MRGFPASGNQVSGIGCDQSGGAKVNAPSPPTRPRRCADPPRCLVYGRSRPDDEVAATGPITLDDLHALFPGF